MVVSSIYVPPDPARDKRALELVDQVDTWPRCTLKIACGAFEPGTVFRRARGSNGARYLVNSSCCTCPDYQQNGAICKHVRAVVLWERRQEAERDRRQVVGAEHAPTASPTSWRPCVRQCGALLAPEHTGKMCEPCFQRIATVLDLIEPFALNPLEE